MNSKGTIMDIYAVLLLLFMFAVVGVLGYYVLDVVNATGVLGSFLVYFKNFFGAFALALPIGVAGLIVVASVLAYYIRAHPAYIIVAILLTIFGLPIAIALSAAWNSFAASPALASTFTDLALLSIVMSNLPVVWLGGASLIMISSYMGYEKR